MNSEYEEALTGAEAESYDDVFEGWDAQGLDDTSGGAGEAQDTQEEVHSEDVGAGAESGGQSEAPGGTGQEDAAQGGGQTEPPSGAGQADAAHGEEPGNAQAMAGGQAAASASGAEPTYTVKFYGQERELPVSELVRMAQKGMDYDNVRQRADAAAPVMALMQQYAAASGMSLEQYLHVAQQGIAKAQAKPMIDKGMPEAEAKELVALRADKARREAQERAAAQREAKIGPYMQLLQAYPEIMKTGTLPQAVRERIDAGEPPLAAYRAYKLDELTAQMAAQRQAQKNKAAAPGSAAGTGAGKRDPFLAAFDAAGEY